MNYGYNAQQGPGGAVGGNTNHDYARQATMEKAAMAGQMAAVPSRASEAMFHELGNHFTFLGELIVRLEALADRATGSIPDPKVQGGMHAPNNLNEKISCTVQVVDEANSRISAALQRLESFV